MNFIPLSENESKTFDTIRWMSAFVVLCAHFTQIYLRHYISTNVYNIYGLLSQGAVALFFSLSGFMIYKSISSNINKNKKFIPSDYVKSRCLRIYPPLLFALLLMFLLYNIYPLFTTEILNEQVKDRMNFTVNDMFSILLFSQGIFTDIPKMNIPLWSLSLEVWCYILAGLFFTRKYVGAFLSLLLMCCLVIISKDYFIYYFMIWLSGFLCAYFYVKKNQLIKILLLPISLSCLFGMVFLAYKWVLLAQYQYLIAFSCFFGCTSSVLYYVLLRIKKFNFHIKPHLAKISYSLYIIHYPIMLFIFVLTEKLNTTVYSSILIGLVATLICIFTAKYTAQYLENKAWVVKKMQVISQKIIKAKNMI